MFNKNKSDKEEVRSEVTLVSEYKQTTPTNLISVYYDKDGQSCDKGKAYAAVDTIWNGEDKTEHYFVAYNNSQLCHVQFNPKKISSTMKQVNHKVFLNYMNYLLNKRDFAYANAKER